MFAKLIFPRSGAAALTFRRTVQKGRGTEITCSIRAIATAGQKQRSFAFAEIQTHPGKQINSKSPLTTQVRTMASSPANEWEKSPAEFDFRSDTLTTPTKSMLESLAHVSLGDDVFKESTTTTKIEQRLATLFGKPAALFVLSGTMGNQISLRSHLTQPPHSILLDAKSHIQKHEAGGVATLSQALTTPVHASNGKYITLEDVKREVILSDDIHFAPTRVICLENTIHGVIVPLEEIHRISEFARQHGIKVHLDGARLWNACSVPDSPSLEEYAAEVDSLSICFSKSLSAPAGSFILGEEKFINHARHVRKAIGGGIRQAGILTAMAEIALDDVFLAGELTKANNFAMEIERTWKELGGEVELPADTNMVWLDLKKRGVDAQVLEEEAKKLGVKLWGNRIVCHFQNSDKAVERLAKALEISCEKADASQKKLDRERESAIR